MIILQYGGIFLDDYILMNGASFRLSSNDCKWKAPEGYEAFEGDDGAYKVKVYA